jgi:fructokinase
VRIDTDVNGAVLAEYLWGAGQGFDSLCYVTIGTGVGAGLLVEGRCVHGAMHPEIGHLRLRRAPGDRFAGSCAFHGDCIEGLVSGPALAKRFGMPGEEIPDDHWQWRHVASDLAELVGAILHTTAPWRIMFGGSVPLARPFLLDQVREIAVDRFASYLPFLDRRSAQDIIGLASLGTQAGPLGALALANEATK